MSAAAKLVNSSNVCPSCGGTGWKNLVVNGDRRVARCECFLQTRVSQLLEASGIPARHVNCDFSSYETGASSILAAAKISVEKWADQYPLDKTGLLLVGPSGVGKTHLSVAAIKRLLNKGVHCLFCDYRELLKQIQNSYNPTVHPTELQRLRPLFESDIVVLDDLGAVKPSEWVWDTVSLVLNTRYNENRTTIITANFEDGPAATGRKDTLGDRIGERMRSRLFEMCRLVKVDGKDFREKFRSAGFR
jgi:DNA replication protein DnaC